MVRVNIVIFAYDGKSVIDTEERRSLDIISSVWLSLSTFHAWWYEYTERLGGVQLKEFLSKKDLSGESKCIVILRAMVSVK